MEFGLFSNGERGNRIAADTFDEDLREVQLADLLGFQEAWISEHIGRTDSTLLDGVAAADQFIMKAAALTERIKLGPAVRPIAIYDPIQVAIEGAMCDHLTRGRYMFGFGVGGPGNDAMVQRGLGDPSIETRRERVQEAWQLIKRCWDEEEPFDHDGKYWHGRGIRVLPRPFTNPRMPVGVACLTSTDTMGLAARDGLMPLFSQYTEPPMLKKMGDHYTACRDSRGRAPRRSNIRVSRFVYVADTMKAAKEDLRPTLTPSIERHKRDFPHHFKEILPPSGDVADVTWDYLVDNGHYFVGDPDTVRAYLQRYYDESGGFGVLLLVVGKDYGSWAQRERSMTLFTQEIAPMLKDLNPDGVTRKAELF